MSLHDGNRRFLHIAHPAVIAQPLPEFEQQFLRRGGEPRHIRQVVQEVEIVGDDRFHAGLLQHNFGDPDAVGVLGFPPREVTRGGGVPCKQRRDVRQGERRHLRPPFGAGNINFTIKRERCSAPLGKSDLRRYAGGYGILPYGYWFLSGAGWYGIRPCEFYFKNPLMICSSASFSVSPRVMSLISCSPAILPMAAS